MSHRSVDVYWPQSDDSAGGVRLGRAVSRSHHPKSFGLHAAWLHAYLTPRNAVVVQLGIICIVMMDNGRRVR